MPTWTTQRFWSLATVSGQRNEFQLARKNRIASEAMIGRLSGRTTLQ